MQLAIAALVAVFNFLGHTIQGTREVHPPLFASELDNETKVALYVCFHVASCVLGLIAFVLVRSALGYRNRTLEAVAGLMSLSGSILFIAICPVVFGSIKGLTQMGQWLPLGLVGMLALSASRR